MDPGPQRAGAPVNAGPLAPDGPPGSAESAPEHSHTNGNKVLNVRSAAYLDHGALMTPKSPPEADPPADGQVQLPHQEAAQTSGPPMGASASPGDSSLDTTVEAPPPT